MVNKEPANEDTWVTVYGKDSAKVPSLQVRAFTCMAVCMYITSRSDRGVAYLQWVAKNGKQLLAFFGDYTIRVRNTNATVPLQQMSVKDIVALAEIQARSLETSLALEEPVRSTRNVSESVQEEEFELVL
jgi:hypothetical protein